MYCICIVLYILLKGIKINNTEWFLIFISLFNACFVTFCGFLNSNYYPYYSYYILRLMLIYIFFNKIVRIDSDSYDFVFICFLFINIISIILDFFNIPSIEPLFDLIKNERVDFTI